MPPYLASSYLYTGHLTTPKDLRMISLGGGDKAFKVAGG